jgi:hypothetical protein
MPDRKWFKGTAAQAIDDWYRTGDVEANLREAQQLLSGGQPYAAVVDELASNQRWNRDDFPYPLAGGALAGDDFENITRSGYLKAIELALNHSPPVPIETFWMTGAGNTQFEMHISDQTDCVAVTVLAPHVEGGDRTEGMPEAWVVRFDGGGNVENRQTSGPGAR